MNAQEKVLLTGATGYVGGRLLKELEERQIPVRCLVRRPEALGGQVAATTEILPGDVFDASSLDRALQGARVAYYLVHSLTSKGVFEDEEKQAARNFAEACRKAGVSKIIYLGGLGEAGTALSPHLRSRQEVGEILRGSGLPVIEFRASVILGSGSLSFEIIRSLVEKLPLMTTPRWVRTPTQPIAIEDVVAYLLEARGMEVSQSEIFEIGGSEVVCYRDLLLEYARQRGLKRCLIPLPFLSPGLSSLWLGLVTPVYARVGRKLVEGLRNPTCVRDPKALSAFSVRPMGMRAAIERALRKEDEEFIQSHWSDAFSSGKQTRPANPAKLGIRLLDSRKIHVAAPPERAFRPIQVIGGENGWYAADPLWRLRGFVDLLLGGVGMRRGRRDPEHLQVGDALDFWRVAAFEPNRRLLLRAEMRVPGRAWLEFELEEEAGGTTIHQHAFFEPLGLWGRLYWYSLLPFHNFIFGGMLETIRKRAEAGE